MVFNCFLGHFACTRDRRLNCNFTFAALWFVHESLNIAKSILSPTLDSFAQDQLCTLYLLRYPSQAFLASYINIGYHGGNFSQPVLEVYSFFFKTEERFVSQSLSLFPVSAKVLTETHSPSKSFFAALDHHCYGTASPITRHLTHACCSGQWLCMYTISLTLYGGFEKWIVCPGGTAWLIFFLTQSGIE